MEITKVAGGMGKDAIKANNIYAILNCIYKHAPVSRRDIARMVSLTPSTVTLLVAEMLRCGLVREGDEVEAGPRAGRRMVQLSFNSRFGYFLGICIEPGSLSFALTDMSGGDPNARHIIDSEVLPNTYTPEVLLNELLRLTDCFLARQKQLNGRFCAIGVSISGHADPQHGISVNSYGVLPTQTDVAAVFEKHYGVPAFLDNNVRSLAKAEMTLQQDGTLINGLFIKQDPGFGCTLLLNSEVFEGASDRSGEVGHTRVVKGGRACSCGKTGCLSTVVGTQALLESAAAVLSPTGTPALWSACGGQKGLLTVAMLVQSAEQGDGPVCLLLEEAASLMAGVLETSLLLMDGDTVIAYGPLFEGEWFLQKLGDILQESFGSFRGIRVMLSKLGDNERWKGPALDAQRRYLRVVSMEISSGGCGENEDTA